MFVDLFDIVSDDVQIIESEGVNAGVGITLYYIEMCVCKFFVGRRPYSLYAS